MCLSFPLSIRAFYYLVAYLLTALTWLVVPWLWNIPIIPLFFGAPLQELFRWLYYRTLKWVWGSVCTYVCTYIHMYVCPYEHMYIRTCVCVYVSEHSSTYVYVCTYIHAYIRIWVWGSIHMYVFWSSLLTAECECVDCKWSCKYLVVWWDLALLMELCPVDLRNNAHMYVHACSASNSLKRSQQACLFVPKTGF